jgi:hypothetical protein
MKIALDRGFIITASKEKLGIKNPLFNLGFLTPRESPNIQFDIISNSLKTTSMNVFDVIKVPINNDKKNGFFGSKL